MTLTPQDFQDAANDLNCDVASIKAVCEVEAPRGGFNPDGTPVTLFEGHKFYKYTEGRYTVDAPDLCYKNWTKIYYGKTWQQEQSRLSRAKALDLEAALMSASWGKFQVMGFNYESAGFTNVHDFVAAMHKSEREHLMAFIGFVRRDGIAPFLRNRDWGNFARKYNGASYKDNRYDEKLAMAYAKYAGEDVESVAEVVTETVTEAIQEAPVKQPHPAVVFIMALFKFLTGFRKT